MLCAIYGVFIIFFFAYFQMNTLGSWRAKRQARDGPKAGLARAWVESCAWWAWTESRAWQAWAESRAKRACVRLGPRAEKPQPDLSPILALFTCRAGPAQNSIVPSRAEPSTVICWAKPFMNGLAHLTTPIKSTISNIFHVNFGIFLYIGCTNLFSNYVRLYNIRCVSEGGRENRSKQAFQCIEFWQAMKCLMIQIISRQVYKQQVTQ